MTSPRFARAATAIDLHVGTRLKRRRTELHVTQACLASSVGITSQQLQKYEKGSNRIRAGRRFEIAAKLGVSVQYFFDGYDAIAATAENDRLELSELQSR